MNDQVEHEEPDQILCGPGKLTLHLDASEMYPNEPGLGTPMLFQWGAETMTWACGYEGGNLCEIIPKEYQASVDRWLEEIAEDVTAWESHWWEVKSK